MYVPHVQLLLLYCIVTLSAPAVASGTAFTGLPCIIGATSVASFSCNMSYINILAMYTISCDTVCYHLMRII